MLKRIRIYRKSSENYEDQQIGFFTIENGVAREFIYKGSIQSDKLVLNWEKTNGTKYSADFVKHK